ncbi:P-loop containing nucleoside triphosphate hydrolase protein [Parasitella parasitica]|nr:P-loop containing nucleoside triphosphate hydrolase protein [Parasitella parasitica]
MNSLKASCSLFSFLFFSSHSCLLKNKTKNNLKMSTPLVVTIGISGPSCSGKTTLALLLKKLLSKVIVINQDEFFKPDDRIPVDEKTGLINWDSPSAVDFESLNRVINKAREDPYSFLAKSERPLQNNHHGSDSLSLKDFNELGSKLDALESIIFVIVEGFLLFCDQNVCDNLDNKFFVKASKQILKMRRESRKGYVTLQGYWVDPPGYFDRIVWPQYILWNDHLLHDETRDPTIQVLDTGDAVSKDITNVAVEFLYHKYNKYNK